MERRITALKAQKKNPNRISVFLDGEYAFGLARIVAAWLQVGQTIDDEKIARLQQQDSVEVALVRALRLTTSRNRSVMEIERRLADQGYDEEVIQTVVERLRTNGVLSDERFAESWVESRGEFKPRSRKLLQLELRQKGVSQEIIAEALQTAESEDQLAYQAASRYARRLAGLDYETFRQKLGSFLLRRGFSYGTTGPIVRQVWDELRPVQTKTEDEENG